MDMVIDCDSIDVSTRGTQLVVDIGGADTKDVISALTDDMTAYDIANEVGLDDILESVDVEILIDFIDPDFILDHLGFDLVKDHFETEIKLETLDL